MAYNAAAQRRYRQSAKGLAKSRTRDRARADQRREQNRAYAKEWREANPDYLRTRYQTIERVRSVDNRSSSLRCVLARLTWRKRIPTRWRRDSVIGALLGCSPIELITHFETQFQPGMDWSNRGSVWEVSYIEPGCFHYMNLRPEFLTKNRRRDRKGDPLSPATV